MYCQQPIQANKNAGALIGSTYKSGSLLPALVGRVVALARYASRKVSAKVHGSCPRHRYNHTMLLHYASTFTLTAS